MLSGGDTAFGIAPDFIRRFGFHPGNFVYEISERHATNMQVLHDGDDLEKIKSVLQSFRKNLFRSAIDDFGTGLSGPFLLYHSEPDYIKLDRFFISGIATDLRKKLFVSTTIQMASTLGISVIAEGIETKEDFYACIQVGCDYLQGYLIQKPTTFTPEIRRNYEIVGTLRNADRRKIGNDQQLIAGRMEWIEPIRLYQPGQQAMIGNQEPDRKRA